MLNNQEIFYQLLCIGVPILLGLLSFIGGLAVNSLFKMAKDIGSIKVVIESISIRHDDLEKRFDKVETKVFK